MHTFPCTYPGASPAVTPAKPPERAASRTARGSARSKSMSSPDRRERRRLEDAVFLRQEQRLHFLQVRLPLRIPRHHVAPRRPVVEAVEAPHEHDLVEVPGLGGEIESGRAHV